MPSKDAKPLKFKLASSHRRHGPYDIGIFGDISSIGDLAIDHHQHVINLISKAHKLYHPAQGGSLLQFEV